MTNPNVFLDLDSTLARTYHLHELGDRPDVLAAAKPVFRDLVNVARPGLADFLKDLSRYADVRLLTAAKLGYAKTILVAHGVHAQFRSFHSTQVEKPFSIAEAVGLGDSPWFLVDDTRPSDPVLKYKLNCLGVAQGRENSRVVVDRCYIGIKPYNPHAKAVDRELRKTLGTILERLDKRDNQIKFF